MFTLTIRRTRATKSTVVAMLLVSLAMPLAVNAQDTALPDDQGLAAEDHVPALPDASASWDESSGYAAVEASRAEANAAVAPEEGIDWNVSSAQLQAAPRPPAVPFLMMISTITQCEVPDDVCERTYGVYEAVMQGVAAEWPRGRYAQIDGAHAFFDQPDAQAMIDRVIAAARNPESWEAAPAGTPTAQGRSLRNAQTAAYSGAHISPMLPFGAS